MDNSKQNVILDYYNLNGFYLEYNENKIIKNCQITVSAHKSCGELIEFMNIIKPNYIF